jgi:hypothetical protein
MVHDLGRFCIERGLFWIPCHDGWLGVGKEEGEILKKVSGAFFAATGYAVRIARKKLAVQYSNSIEEVMSSYVPTGPTLPKFDYKKAAREWFASLPRHPQF